MPHFHKANRDAAASFFGPSDAYATAELFTTRVGGNDDLLAHARVTFLHGTFLTNADGALPSRHDVCNDGQHAQLVISFRDGADCEAQIVTRALRWIADQIDQHGLVIQGDHLP